VLWDVFGEAELLGGAPLNFSVAAQRLANSVALLTAVGQDMRGLRALQKMTALGLSTELVQVSPEHATGTAIVRTDQEGNHSYLIERPAAFDSVHISEVLLRKLVAFQPDWIYFGTLAQTERTRELMLQGIIDSSPGCKCFYDLNLRTGHWNLPLVQRLSRHARVLKLNEAEADCLWQKTQGGEEFDLAEFCRRWCTRYGVETICITRGSEGCAVFSEGNFSTFEGFAVEVVDTVGAGDAFAAAFLHGLNAGWPTDRTASFANALGAVVASRAGATPAWTAEDCQRLIESQPTSN
jgi:fructokinase